MAKATYLQKGESLDYFNATAKMIEAGSVVGLVTRIGIAGGDILAGEIGAVHMVGVFSLPKADKTKISMGGLVYYKDAGITATAESNIPAGYAAAESAADETEMLVKLLG